MKLLLEKVQCEKYKWNICGDLNVTALLLGHTKFCCLLWEWDSTDRKKTLHPKSGLNKYHSFQDRKM